MEFDLIIIGAGPGGYEMAAEAAHQGMNVALVERDKLGGTCLNRGCIPTKALCRNAEVVATMREAARWGVNTGDIAVDYAAAAARKDEVVDQLRNGVETLMGMPGITFVRGEAHFEDAQTIVCGDDPLSVVHGISIKGGTINATVDSSRKPNE